MRPIGSSQSARWNRLWSLLFTVAAILMVPIVPFLIWQDAIRQLWEKWGAVVDRPLHAALLVVTTLATDILLPIPSSAVATYAGGVLGWPLGSLAVWIGLNVSAIIGYGLAAWLGYPIAIRISSASALESTAPVVARYGHWLLLLSRPIPVIAEAAVLVCGLQRIGWAQTLWPIAFGNAGFAVALCALGDAAHRGQWMAAAMLLSIAVPSILFLGFMRLVRR